MQLMKTCPATPPRWRAALLRALVVFGASTVLITELLSYGRALRSGPLALSWLAVFVIVAVIAWKRRPAHPLPRWPGWIDAGLIIASVAISGVVLFVALSSAPNSTDAMA